MGAPLSQPRRARHRRRAALVAAAVVLAGGACDLSDPSLATTLITDPGGAVPGALHATVGQPDVLVDGATQIAVAETGLIVSPGPGAGLRPLGAAALAVSVSTDGGGTWAAASVSVPAGFGATQPRLALDARHQRFLLTANLAAVEGPTGLPRLDTGIWASAEGRSWEPLTLSAELGGTLGRVGPPTCDNVATSTSFGTCYAAFLTRRVVPGPPPAPESRVVIGRTSDGGDTWSAVEGFAYGGGPVALSARPDGGLGVAYVEGETLYERTANVAGGTPFTVTLTVPGTTSVTGTVEIAAATDGMGRRALAWNGCARVPDCARDDILTALPGVPLPPPRASITTVLPRGEGQADEHRTRPRITLDPTKEGGVAVGYLAVTGGEHGTVRAVVHKAVSARQAALVTATGDDWTRDELTPATPLDWFPWRPGAPASAGAPLVGPVAVALRADDQVVPVYQGADEPPGPGRFAVRLLTITDPPDLQS